MTERVPDEEINAIIELEDEWRRRHLAPYRPARDYLMAREIRELRDGVPTRERMNQEASDAH